jgi:membrane protease subunit (stomatin/prohibitin family)
MFRRRRPLLRAAVVGGGAYMAGKHVARSSAEQQQQEQGQDQQAPAPTEAPAPSSPMTDQLNQLAALHQQGVLTDDEFSAAKAKLIGT